MNCTSFDVKRCAPLPGLPLAMERTNVRFHADARAACLVDIRVMIALVCRCDEHLTSIGIAQLFSKLACAFLLTKNSEARSKRKQHPPRPWRLTPKSSRRRGFRNRVCAGFAGSLSDQVHPPISSSPACRCPVVGLGAMNEGDCSLQVHQAKIRWAVSHATLQRRQRAAVPGAPLHCPARDGRSRVPSCIDRLIWRQVSGMRASTHAGSRPINQQSRMIERPASRYGGRFTWSRSQNPIRSWSRNRRCRRNRKSPKNPCPNRSWNCPASRSRQNSDHRRDVRSLLPSCSMQR